MGNVKDLTGQRFGKLTVIGIGTRKNNAIVWECQCDCGNVTTVRGSNLTSGLTKSCGCLRAEGGKATARNQSMAGLRKCIWDHPDCFALVRDGKCSALSDVRFPDRDDCPFYKRDREGKR